MFVELYWSLVKFKAHVLQVSLYSLFDQLFIFYFQGHLDVCRFDGIPCPNQCSDVLSRLSLEDHLEYGCPKRIVICEFCNQEFPGEAFDLVIYSFSCT